ncbi:hypothetical protein Z043_110148 [Scleropages formosus]|uniref:Uncharacterized protein n=1 Tax=Scleropages formosus TaxID=113540 RepID=A0A0P7UAM3_SCLFO|nr:hypothetical protein Z043_110148 [Scleropages formosus]
MYHARTNIIGLADSITWCVPVLPHSIYLFLASLSVPVINSLVAQGPLLWWVWGSSPTWGALLWTDILSWRIDLPKFSLTSQPKRVQQMTHWVLNLSPESSARLDFWALTHQLSSGAPPLPLSARPHVKSIVSRYLKEKGLSCQEDGCFSHLCCFFHNYQELVVFAPTNH